MTIRMLTSSFCEPLLHIPRQFLYLRPCLRRLPKSLPISRRTFHGSATLREQDFDPKTIERESDEVDVCIIGGGPAGLSAAIRLKQLAEKHNREMRVLLLEKGSEMGNHPIPLNQKPLIKGLRRTYSFRSSPAANCFGGTIPELVGKSAGTDYPSQNG